MGSKLLKIDNIMYRVSDLGKAADFYGRILGLKKLWADDDAKMIGFGLAKQDAEIVIHANNDLPAFDYSFLVEDVRSLTEDLRKQGCAIVEEPFQVRTGWYAIAADLDGNKIPLIDLSRFGGEPKYDK